MGVKVTVLMLLAAGAVLAACAQKVERGDVLVTVTCQPDCPDTMNVIVDNSVDLERGQNTANPSVAADVGAI